MPKVNMELKTNISNRIPYEVYLDEDLPWEIEFLIAKILLNESQYLNKLELMKLKLESKGYIIDPKQLFDHIKLSKDNSISIEKFKEFKLVFKGFLARKDKI